MATKIYPYPTLTGDPNLTITKILVDGNKPAVEPVNVEARVIDLHAIPDTDWAYVAMTVRVEASSDEIRALDGAGAEVGACVVVYNSEAETRTSVRLVRAEKTSALWLGKLELDRVNLRGKVTLRALITGTIEGIANRFLGESPTWTIWVDEPPTPVLEGTINVQWKDFTQDGDRPAVVDKEYAHEISFIDLVSPVPTVYLNKGLKGLTQLLSKPPSDPAQLALHDVQMTSIAIAAWFAMFEAAAAAVEDPGDEDPVWPATDWQERVLKLLLPRIYDCGAEEALAKVVEDMRTSEGASDLASRAQAAIAAHTKSAKRLAKSIKALDVLEEKETEDV